MQIPDADYLPESVKLIISAVLGAGGVGFVRVWLENRRLSKKEFRETLMDRIRELDAIVSRMQKRMGNLRVEMAHLETENIQLRKELGLRPKERNANREEEGGSDVESA